ncbi:MAG: 2-succinyl-5-enolpyruvyl-6-hydroxy-3-cyclohexene-1-carboxylic-acid synthase [Flavobacteriales bacterium]|jgi:2-succinyl-5-enolpyruvyl-6-hydroxy-3-cyclohexene-1-carboxylate synthase|tara:strand:- start:5238 stop:6851 length:1614 start_codon:yes stop_codon:yes gene_type:complete
MSAFQSTAALLAQALDHIELAAWVSSPGSRNAPVVLALSELETPHRVMLDERSAAHVALGAALQSGKPCAVVCTSGTAAMNFGPAVAEAFYQRIPLLLITADRPAGMIDNGHGQSIRQVGLFRQHVRAEANLQVDHGDVELIRQNASALRKALKSLTYGPVHINIPLDEPLYGKPRLPMGFPASFRLDLKPVYDEHLALPTFLVDAKRPLLIVGQMLASRAFIRQVAKLRQQGWLVVAEHLSNLPVGMALSLEDAILQKDASLFKPDAIVSVGGSWMAKQAKAMLAGLPHLSVADAAPFPNLFDGPFATWACGAEDALACLLDSQLSTAGWQLPTMKLEVNRPSDRQLTDLSVHMYLASLPLDGWDIHWGNSMSVRQGAHAFAKGGWAQKVTHYGNRGASGIDGSTSTALGSAWMSSKPTLLITGELSAQYDLNAMLQSNIPVNLHVLIINNGGGQIFQVIDGPKSAPNHESHFLFQHERSFEDAANYLKVPYMSAHDMKSFESAMAGMMQSPNAAIVEVFTDPMASERSWKRRQDA